MSWNRYWRSMWIGVLRSNLDVRRQVPMVVGEDLLAEPRQFARIRLRYQVHHPLIGVGVVPDHAVFHSRDAPCSQALVVGNHKLLLCLVISDRSWEISGRDIANHRMRIPPLQVDDCQGIGLAQRDIRLPVLRDGNAIRPRAKDAVIDRNTEADGSCYPVGMEINHRQAVAIRIGDIELGTVNRHPRRVQAHSNRFHFPARRKIHHGHRAR